MRYLRPTYTNERISSTREDEPDQTEHHERIDHHLLYDYDQYEQDRIVTLPYQHQLQVLTLSENPTVHKNNLLTLLLLAYHLLTHLLLAYLLLTYLLLANRLL